MSSVKSVNIINKKIERLDTRFEEMKTAAENFLNFVLPKENASSDATSKIENSLKIFKDYHTYHTLLTKLSYSLITKLPNLPDQAIPQFNSSIPSENGKEKSDFSEMLQSNGKSLIEGVVLLGSIITLGVLAALKIIPYMFPVILAIASIIIFCAPNLITWAIDQFRKKEEDDLSVDTTNPSEWVSTELQVLSNKYDAIRILIFAQDNTTDKLASVYRKKVDVLYRRGIQEAQLFPNECLTVVRRIMIFCTQSYDEISETTISHLPLAQPNVTPQFPNDRRGQ